MMPPKRSYSSSSYSYTTNPKRNTIHSCFMMPVSMNICTEHNGTEIPDSIPLTYFHRVQKQKCRTTEQEAFGVYLASQIAINLQGMISSAESDHKPLACFLNGKNTNNIVNRWSLELATYNISFEWISGTRNKAADCLSRLVTPTSTPINMLTASSNDGPAFHTRSHTQNT